MNVIYFSFEYTGLQGFVVEDLWVVSGVIFDVESESGIRISLQFSDGKFLFTDHQNRQVQIFKINFRIQNDMHQKVNVNAHKVVRINVKT